MVPLLEVPLEPLHMGRTLRRQDVGANAVREEAVVGDDGGQFRETFSGRYEGEAGGAAEYPVRGRSRGGPVVEGGVRARSLRWFAEIERACA